MRSRIVLCVIAFLALAGLAGAETILWIPAAASNPGLNDTQWSTDLWLYSRVVDSPIEVFAAFLPNQAGAADPTEVTIQLPQRQVVEISDAVATLFGDSRPGAIRLRSEHPFWAQSRTFNDGDDDGTYGQGIPAFPPPMQTGPTQVYVLMGAANRPGTDGARTNLGIVNTGAETREVIFGVRDTATGDVVGATEVELGPDGWYQADVFQAVGAADQTVDLAEVQVGVTSPAGNLLAYISRVDNRSGDGAFLAGVTGEFVRIVPRPWEVELVLSYSTPVVVDELTYTAPDGTTVTVPNPVSGYSTGTLDFISPATFCWTVTGATHGGTVTVDIYTSVDGSNGHSRTGTTGEDPLDLSGLSVLRLTAGLAEELKADG